MTWPRALSYVAVWLCLTALWVVHTRSTEPMVVRSVIQASPLADMTAEQVTEVEIEGNGRAVRAARLGDRWKVTHPEEASLPSDLLSALVAALLDARDIEVVRRDDANEEEFGLSGPAPRITFRRADGSSLRVSLGSENPARTALYAQREGSSDVFLLGLNVRYYLNLALRAAEPRAPE